MAIDRSVQFGIEENFGDYGNRPRIRILTDYKIERIHGTTVEILEIIGVKVTRPDVVDMMAVAGCDVTGDEVVPVPPRLLEDAMTSAPKKITIYDREGNEALQLGRHDVYIHTEYTPLEDFRLVSRVADAHPTIPP